VHAAGGAAAVGAAAVDGHGDIGLGAVGRAVALGGADGAVALGGRPVALDAPCEVLGVGGVGGRGLHSCTFQLNLSALYGIGGARKGTVARVKGVFGGILAVYGVCVYQTRLKLS